MPALPDFPPPFVVRDGDNVTLSAPRGTIDITTDSSGSRGLGGSVSASAREYQVPLQLPQPTTINTRVAYRGEWRVLERATR